MLLPHAHIRTIIPKGRMGGREHDLGSLVEYSPQEYLMSLDQSLFSFWRDSHQKHLSYSNPILPVPTKMNRRSGKSRSTILSINMPQLGGINHARNIEYSEDADIALNFLKNDSKSLVLCKSQRIELISIHSIKGKKPRTNGLHVVAGFEIGGPVAFLLDEGRMFILKIATEIQRFMRLFLMGTWTWRGFFSKEVLVLRQSILREIHPYFMLLQHLAKIGLASYMSVE